MSITLKIDGKKVIVHSQSSLEEATYKDGTNILTNKIQITL